MKNEKMVYFNGKKVCKEKLDYSITSFDKIVTETFDFKNIYCNIIGNKKSAIITINIENVLYVIDTEEKILKVRKRLPDEIIKIDNTQVIMADNLITFYLDKGVASEINLSTANIVDNFGREIKFIGVCE